MVEIYRIEKGAETWKYKAYDYVRTDAFCVGQSIPIELEFSHDEKEEDLQAVILIEDHQASGRLPNRFSQTRRPARSNVSASSGENKKAVTAES